MNLLGFKNRLLFLSFLCIHSGYVFGQKSIADIPIKGAIVMETMDSIEGSLKMDRTKYIKPKATVDTQVISIGLAEVNRLKSKITHQEILISSQDMMIEQILKRLEVLENQFEEKPLDLVTTVPTKKE